MKDGNQNSVQTIMNGLTGIGLVFFGGIFIVITFLAIITSWKLLVVVLVGGFIMRKMFKDLDKVSRKDFSNEKLYRSFVVKQTNSILVVGFIMIAVALLIMFVN